MLANWRQTSGWGATDDPTGVLGGRVLVAVGGPSTRAEDYLSTEIGTSASWTKAHYRVETAFAWYAATDAHPMASGALALIARASDFAGSPALARSCYLGVLDFEANEALIVRRNSDAETVLLRAALPAGVASRGSRHVLTFEATGESGSVRLVLAADGVTLGTVGDTDAARLLSGAPGLRAFSGTAYLDEFGVYELTSDGAGPPLWAPDDASVSLAGWWRADAGVTVGDGGAVSSWADQSGNANDAVQASGSAQPVRLSGAINSLPVIVFDGSDDRLVAPDDSSLDLYSVGISVLVVLNPVTYGTATGEVSVGAVVEKAGDSPSYRLDLRDEVGANPPAVLDGAAFVGASTARSSSSSVKLARYSIVEALAGAGAQGPGLYVDGVSVGSISGSVASDTTGGLVLGGTTGRFFDGAIAEIVLYRGPLSTADRQRVEGYLAHRYGLAVFLPGDHPYRATAPTA